MLLDMPQRVQASVDDLQIVVSGCDSRHRALSSSHIRTRKRLVAATQTAAHPENSASRVRASVLDFVLPAPRLSRPSAIPQISFPIATAVSAIRFEKPHSLSYQESTRTKVPSITLVWSIWKIEEWLSWLKSAETFGN